MKINLLEALKTRLFDEIEETISRNAVYRDKVKVYHKFSYKERPSMGVVIKNISFSRLKLSPDDFVGIQKSYCAMAKAGNHPGEFLEWVWEDANNITKTVKEDVSSQITGSNRVIHLQHGNIIKGPGSDTLADNNSQVFVWIDGVKTYPSLIFPDRGEIYLATPPPAGSKVAVSYSYSNAPAPGRYYIEIVKDGDTDKFVVNPLYKETDELIPSATGSEPGAAINKAPLLPNQEVLVVTDNYGNSYRLKRDTDYSISDSGEINFINGFSLSSGDKLIATYRWVGDELGPFDIPKKFRYDNKAIRGISLAFNDRVVVGDKLVIIVYPRREISARVHGGHFSVSIDIQVFTKDTRQLPSLTDYIINDIWNRKRLGLMSEGITIEELDSTGESEEVYDENTGDLYYMNSLSMSVLTEWKRFTPTLFAVRDFDIKVNRVEDMMSSEMPSERSPFGFIEPIENMDRSVETGSFYPGIR